jgi:hypothetical protein
MAGSLIKIDEEIVTSAVASVTLTGIDSTYDVYMVRLNNVQPDTDIVTLETRFTVSGTPDTSANYDEAFKTLRANTTFNNAFDTNGTGINLGATGTATGEQMNALLYLFNFNNASEYSFITVEGSTLNNANILFGREGGGVLTVAQACNGIQFFFSSGNIDNGTFTLYGLKK